MATNASPDTVEVCQLVTCASAALHIWIAAVRARRGCIDNEEAAKLQTAVGAVIEAVNEACDDVAVACTVNALPLYRALDLLGLVDSVLRAIQGGDAAAPALADLLDTAELAAATLAKFDVVARPSVAQAPNRQRGPATSNVVQLTRDRTDALHPTP